MLSKFPLFSIENIPFFNHKTLSQEVYAKTDDLFVFLEKNLCFINEPV
ncbi:hypothetical protein VB796_18525 [Arcicella sp. LKC2W]|nr:hypothetical protein [Arcicella sp. LKC2W]MEA5461064.1 hypothetical protein [Arcicella sp. LKC2W]